MPTPPRWQRRIATGWRCVLATRHTPEQVESEVGSLPPGRQSSPCRRGPLPATAGSRDECRWSLTDTLAFADDYGAGGHCSGHDGDHHQARRCGAAPSRSARRRACRITRCSSMAEADIASGPPLQRRSSAAPSLIISPRDRSRPPSLSGDSIGKSARQEDSTQPSAKTAGEGSADQSCARQPDCGRKWRDARRRQGLGYHRERDDGLDPSARRVNSRFPACQISPARSPPARPAR